MNCPDCGSGSNRQVYRRPHASYDLRCLACKDCGFTFNTVELLSSKLKHHSERMISIPIGCYEDAEESAIDDDGEAAEEPAPEPEPQPEPVPEPEPAAVSNVVDLASKQPLREPAFNGRLEKYYPAEMSDDLAGITEAARPLMLEWWNSSRRSKHGSKAAWTRGAWLGSVRRMAELPPWKQVALVENGITNGWQALKAEFIKDEPHPQQDDGTLRPISSAMQQAIERWNTR
jgi:hypothetical protein